MISAKTGKNRHTFGWRRKIIRGKFVWTLSKQHSSARNAHTVTRQSGVSVLTYKRNGFPSTFGKFPFRRTVNQKFRQKFISPRGQQNTTLTHTQKQRKLSGESSTIVATDAAFFVIIVVVIVHARKGRSFPSSESSQRSINNKHLLVGRSKFYWFFRCHWNRQIAHIHTFTHTYTHKYRETNLKRMHRSNFRSILR